MMIDQVSGMAARVFHHVPRFRGLGRILQLVNFAVTRGYVLSGKKPLPVAAMKTGFRMKVDLRSDTEFQAYYTGEYDHSRVQDMLALFEEGAVVLDVGANVGFYSVPFAIKLSGIAGRLHCFEPVPSNFDRLLENLRLNQVASTVSALRVGLSDHEGEALITLREDFAKGGETGNAAVLIEDGQDSAFGTVRVPLSTLDAYAQEMGLSRLDFIKVDIEGHEDAFFRGGKQSIERFRPVILAEMNEDFFRRKGVDIDAGLRQELLAMNYAFMARRGPSSRWACVETLKGRAVTEDILLVPREKLDRVQELLKRNEKA